MRLSSIILLLMEDRAYSGYLFKIPTHNRLAKGGRMFLSQIFITSKLLGAKFLLSSENIFKRPLHGIFFSRIMGKERGGRF